MLNFVSPCKDPLEPLLSTVPDISYESQPKAPTCSLPGCLTPFFIITRFCNIAGGIQDTKNLPLFSGIKLTVVSFFLQSIGNYLALLRFYFSCLRYNLFARIS